MITRPIIPIPLMIIISIILIIIIILSSKKVKLIVRLLIVLMLFLINLRPMIPNGETEVMNNNLDIIFVVDTTLSMDAQDYGNKQTRLSAVKKDIEYIINKIPGAHYSLISFDLDTKIRLPLTSDANALLASSNTLRVIDELYARGSSVTIFREELAEVLKSSKKKENHSRIVFICTDGEQTVDRDIDSLKPLADNVDGGAILGYGTTKGGKIEVENYDGTKEELKDRSSYPYQDAVSVLDESNLKRMAKDLDINYVHMTSSNKIDSEIKAIKKLKNNNDSEIEESYQDIYYYYSPLLSILLFIELSLDRRSELWKR